jgi:AAA ATPase domain
MLLEREHELADFGRVLTAARGARGRVILVEGDAGIGKTSLLQAASETAAAAGLRCLRARASELEREYAFGCVRQLLEPYVLRTPEAERESLFAGAAALSTPLFALPGPSAASVRAHTPFSMLHGLYWLLNNLAEEAPLVALVDDLQWADAESLRFLHYLAPRLDGLALVVVASVRTRDSGHVDVARLAASPETTVVRPGPLSVDGTAGAGVGGLTGRLPEPRAGEPDR